MASFNVNLWVARQQKLTLVATVLGLLIILGCGFLLIPTTKRSTVETLQVAGVIDESFSEANAESALTTQQSELESLKIQLKDLKLAMDKQALAEKDSVAKLIAQGVKSSMESVSQPLQMAQNDVPQVAHDMPTSWQGQARIQSQNGQQRNHATPRLHSVSFKYRNLSKPTDNPLSPLHYVPSGTFVRAVILGGADADASVNGQSKNNGVMLFKLLQQGTLPNGQHSRLQGCFVTGSSYGDISSERAYVVLDKLSCAHKGLPIIDKSVTGWAFFGGKVGIKGVPLMRDNKVMQWAGISGAMSGIAAAAQYSQSVQSISALGSATSVPSNNIAPYAAYGGASKAAEVLSNYYVKRAEQYHPVIQVGSGNLVTIVFKEGFYLKPEPAILQQGRKQALQQDAFASNEENNVPDFTVPQEVLNKINPSVQEGAQI